MMKRPHSPYPSCDTPTPDFATGAYQAAAAGKICGFSAPTMRKLAAAGKIPGAALLVNRWRFDEQRLREWIAEQEAACFAAAHDQSGSGLAVPHLNYAPRLRVHDRTASEYERILWPRGRPRHVS